MDPHTLNDGSLGELQEVTHLLISLSYYKDGDQLISVTDIKANKELQVETAIGLLETAKHLLLSETGTHIAPMGFGLDDLEEVTDDGEGGNLGQPLNDNN